MESSCSNKLKRILSEGIHTDLELVTREIGRTVKCHRVVLSIGSPILKSSLAKHANSLRKDMLKARFMNHLSSDCINAFLAFIYYNDVEKVFSSLEMAVQVLEPALDFEVDHLVSRIVERLVMMGNKEITVDQAIRLFVMVKKCKPEESGDGDGENGSTADADDDMSGGDSDSEADIFGAISDDEDDDNNDQFSAAGEGSSGNAGVVGLRNRDPDGSEENERKRLCQEPRAGFNGGAVELTDGKGISGNNANKDNGLDDNLSVASSIDTVKAAGDGIDQNCRESLDRWVVQLMEWNLKNRANDIRLVQFEELAHQPKVLMQMLSMTLGALVQQQQK